MKVELPVLEADTTQDNALTRSQGPWDRTLPPPHHASERALEHLGHDPQADCPSPALGALIPAILVGVVVFVAALLAGMGLGTALLSYTITGCATFAVLLALASLRAITSGREVTFAAEQGQPAIPQPLPFAGIPTSSARSFPAEWREDCVARPVGSIHDSR